MCRGAAQRTPAAAAALGPVQDVATQDESLSWFPVVPGASPPIPVVGTGGLGGSQVVDRPSAVLERAVW